jgi:hypothetical protein
MKTNHQRNFKSTYNSERFKKSVLGGNSIKSELADRTISAAAYIWDTEYVSAHKRARKNVAGAKKYVRTRVRFHENAAVKKMSITEN